MGGGGGCGCIDSGSVGEVSTFCLGLRASAAPNPVSSSGFAAGVALQRVRVNVRSSTDSEQSTLSEADRRDRTQLQSDIQHNAVRDPRMGHSFFI